MDFASFLKLLTPSSELKGGCLVLGCFSHAFNIFGLFLMFGLGLKLLQFTWQGKEFIQFLCEIRRKLGDKKCGVCSRKDSDKVCDSKMMPFKSSSLKLLENSKTGNKGDLLVSKEPLELNDVALDDDDDYGRKSCFEDEEFDVISLRRLVKIERYRADMAYAELENERMASASAAGEAMTMILRLQSEKSSIKMAANQQRRLAEQHEEYYREVIQSLQWSLMKYESERTVMEEKLTWYEQKLKQYLEVDEVDQFQESHASLSLDVDSTIEDGSEYEETD